MTAPGGVTGTMSVGASHPTKTRLEIETTPTLTLHHSLMEPSLDTIGAPAE
jgi:hypothetical protein